MQIHELNNYSGSIGNAYLAADNGSDTGKMKTTALTDPLNERINNIIAGPAPSAAEITDARLGASGVLYPSLGDAIRGQSEDSAKYFDLIEFEQGAISPTGELSPETNAAHTKRLRSINYYGGDFYLCCPQGFGIYMVVYYDKDTFAFDSYDSPSSVVQRRKIGKDGCVAKIVISKTDSSQTITVDELKVFERIINAEAEYLDINIVPFEQGSIAINGSESTLKTRVRTNGYIRGAYKAEVPDGFVVYAVAYYDDQSLAFDSLVAPDSPKPIMSVGKTDCVSRLVISRSDYSLDLTPDDFKRVFGTEEEPTDDPLKGKRVLNLGDSIASGAGNAGKGYAQIISENCGALLTSLAVAGWTMSGTTDSVNAQIDTALANYGNLNFDFILLEGGTNDVNDVSVGTLLDPEDYDYTQCDVTTFAGALEKAIGRLRNKWNTATIIFISVHKMTSRNYSKQVAYHDKAVECCKKWGIPVADIFEEGQITSYITSIAETCFPASAQSPTGYDRTHPNDLGYKKFYVPLIESIMKQYNPK